MRAGILMLNISALGTGLLTLHHFFDQIGIIIGSIVLFLVFFQFILASDILIIALKKNSKSKSLNQLIENIMG